MPIRERLKSATTGVLDRFRGGDAPSRRRGRYYPRRRQDGQAANGEAALGGVRSAVRRAGGGTRRVIREVEVGQPEAGNDEVTKAAERSTTMADPIGVTMSGATGPQDLDRFAYGDVDADLGALGVDGEQVTGSGGGSMESLVRGRARDDDMMSLVSGGGDGDGMVDLVTGQEGGDDDPLVVEDDLVGIDMGGEG